MPAADPVIADQVAKLGAIQHAILIRSSEGPRLARIEELGDFARVYLDPYGWSADGPARARRLLLEALKRYVETEPKKGLVTAVGYDRPIHSAALRAYWGLDRHPLSIKQVIEMLVTEHAVDPAISQNTVLNWGKEFALDDVVQDAALRHIPDRGMPGSLPSWPRPAWKGGHVDWPQSQNWPPGAITPQNERAMIVDAGQRILRNEGVRRAALVQDSDEPLPVIQGLGVLEDDEVLGLIREIAAKELAERHFGRDAESHALRHLRVRVIGPWTDTPATPVDREPGKLSEVVAVATQMYLHAAVLGDGKALIAAADRLLSRRALPAVTTVAFATKLDSLTKVSTLQVEDGLDPSVGVVYDLAAMLRSSPEGALALIPAYLNRRENLDVNTLSTAEIIRLSLADQSASLDIARAGVEEYIKRLKLAMDKLPVGRQARAYSALLPRDRAITWLQRNREDHALALVGQGFRMLNLLVERDLVDRRSAMEVRHQLCLAAAGDYIRLVERTLVELGPRHPSARVRASKRVTEWVGQMLRYSTRTRTLLDGLESEFKLPEKRHTEGQISAKAWSIRTRIIELRAELVAITAAEAELVSSGPAVSTATNSQQPDLPAAAEHYRDLISQETITMADAAEAVTLGMWVALLNKGKLPIANDLAPALRRDQDLVVRIDHDTDGMSPAVPEYRAVDLKGSTDWLGARRIGIIAEVNVDGPVGVRLSELNPEVYRPWRDWLPTRVLKNVEADSEERPLAVFFDYRFKDPEEPEL